MRLLKFSLTVLLVVGLSVGDVERCSAYSLFTHEQMIDLAWEPAIRPLLLARFPKATAAQLREAHAYAYGGCVIQDLGYYPFSHHFFSDLTHYARSGDFIDSLFRNAKTVDEYAFAVGALSHYIGDSVGHADAVNPATAITFPSLAKKYGPDVTYVESPHGHVRTEFAYDVDQLAHRRFAPSAYLRYIGLGVPRRLLEQAFFETYGLSLHEVLGDERPAIRSYRFAVRSLLPRFAYAEVLIHGKSFPEDDPQDPEFLDFQKRLNQADFQKVWNPYRKRAGFETHLVALLIRIVPKVGAASDLAIRGPNQQTEPLYVKSLNRADSEFKRSLAGLAKTRRGVPKLPNLDLDTGYKIRPGGYALTDKTYAKLLRQITKDPQRPVPEGLRRDILEYYADPNAPILTKKDPRAWQRVLKEMAVLKQMRPAAPTDTPTEPDSPDDGPMDK